MLPQLVLPTRPNLNLRQRRKPFAMKLHRISLSSEALIVAASAFFLLFANHAFWHRLGMGLGEVSRGNWLTYLAVIGILMALLSLLLGLFTPRVALKPVLTALLFDRCGVVLFYGQLRRNHCKAPLSRTPRSALSGSLARCFGLS